MVIQSKKLRYTKEVASKNWGGGMRNNPPPKEKGQCAVRGAFSPWKRGSHSLLNPRILEEEG